MKSSTCKVLVIDNVVSRKTCEEIVRAADMDHLFDLEVGIGIAGRVKVEVETRVDKTVKANSHFRKQSAA